MSTGNCPASASDSNQEGETVGEMANLPAPAAESEQQGQDQSDIYPTTQNHMDPPHDTGSHPTQIAPPQSAQERQESIGNSDVDTQGASGSNASAFSVEDGDEDNCYAYVEVPEGPAGNANQPDGLPPKLLVGKRTFALKKGIEAQKRARVAQATETNGFTDRYDYLKKYPEDPPEEAMGPNARVWRVYLDEAEQFDIDMVDGFKDTVDIMLVFAGLFSAVVTTFVVQASTALQLNYNQVMASILIEQVQIQRAIASGRPAPDPLPTTLNMESTTTTSLDRWANGLWFVSLSFSLATALFAVLIKQWIQSYVSPVSGSPQTRVRVRQYRFIGLERWHVPLIVGLLPTLLHLSLLLFFMGLVAFLFSLDQAIAGVTVFTTTMVYFIYLVTNLAPLFNTQCPYKTPLSTYAFLVLHPFIPGIRARAQFIVHLLRNTIRVINQHTSRAQWALRKFMRALRNETRRFNRSVTTQLKKVYERCSRYFHGASSAPVHDVYHKNGPQTPDSKPSGSMKTCELEDIKAQGDVTDAKALCWVVTWSSNPSVRTVVVEAAGDLRIGYDEQAKKILQDGGVKDAACASLQMCNKSQDRLIEVRSGFEHLHLRAALAHFQLGVYMPFGMEYSGPHARMARAYCRCIGVPWSPSHQNVDGGLGPHISLLQEPSLELVRPQHILQSSPQHILHSGRLPPHNSCKMVSLLSLRRAALCLRTYPSSKFDRDMIDWPSCQKLCALVQLEPVPVDLFGLWQTTLVSVYLASLVPKVAPLSKDSGLLSKLLLGHIELGTGSSQLSQELASNLSMQSCMEFLAYTLQNPTASTSFSSSDGGSRLIRQLIDHVDRHDVWVSDPDKAVIGPHHTLLIALLDRREEHSASISTELCSLMYNLGYCLVTHLVTRDKRHSAESELDLVSLLGRLLRAALIPPQLSEPYELLEVQIFCLDAVLKCSPPESRSILADIFRVYDGISTLEKIIQRAGSELDSIDWQSIKQSLVLYLSWVFPVGEDSLPSLKSHFTPQSHKGQPSGIDSSDHLDYILHRLFQVIGLCVACWDGKISRSETDSYPDTLHILRHILKTQREVSPEWDCAFADLETLGILLGLPDDDPRFEDVEDNLEEVLAVLRSDLEIARSLGAQDSLQPKPLPLQSSISGIVDTKHEPSSDFGSTAAQEVNHPLTCAESLVSRWIRQLRTRVVPSRRVDALIPLHNKTLLQPAQESESAVGNAVEEESPMARRDEEEGLPATDISAT